MSKRIGGPLGRIYAIPAALAVASLSGLVAALVGDGLLDLAAWLGLGTPVAVIVWALAVRRS